MSRFALRFYHSFAPLLLGAGLVACVEPYSPALNLNGQKLTVEATITDQPESQFVKLSYAVAKPFSEFEIVPVSGASAQVVVNGSTTLALQENPAGTYQLPEGFRGKVGERYRLRFTTSDGRRYESGEETLRAVPTVDSTYDRFDPKAISRSTDRSQFWPAHIVYANFNDPAGERNYYGWSWTLWEKQDWCGSVKTFGQPTGYYDYNCRTKCWELLFSETLTVFADTYSDGRTVTGQEVARIPYYQAVSPISAGALVEIRQYSLSPGAYRYLKLLVDQTQNTGGLADTPPTPLVGNVRNLADETELVTGYFTASSVAKRRHWIDRSTGYGPPIGLFLALNGRPPNPEPFSCNGYGCRPPTFYCIPSATRTPNQPDGWRGF
jgi:hypothetical protein